MFVTIPQACVCSNEAYTPPGFGIVTNIVLENFIASQIPSILEVGKS